MAIHQTGQWVSVQGTLIQGYRVASGLAQDSPYPRGTIAMQRPFFHILGLDISQYFLGTLNLSIAPHEFKMEHPQYTFRRIAWTFAHPAEDFSFSACRITFQEIQYHGMVYYPHPETKKRHFHNPSILEILAPKIPEIQYGDHVTLELNSAEITLV